MTPKSAFITMSVAMSCLVAGLAGCQSGDSAKATTTDPVASGSSSPSPSASPTRVNQQAAAATSASIRKYLSGRSGQASIAIKDLTTGKSYSYNSGLRVATASIVKADILASLLLKAQAAGRHLTASEKATATKMIENSDNAAASALWNKIGRKSGMSAANKKLGLTQTVPGSGSTWGLTTTSAADQVRLMTALTSGSSKLTSASRTYELGLMSQVERDQRWGVSAAKTDDDDSLWLKNGWMPRTAHQNRWTINSIGRVKGSGHDYLIGVVSQKNASMADGIATIQKLVKLAVKTMN